MKPNAADPSPARYLFAIGLIALGAVALASGDFLLGQPVPKALPGRPALALTAALFLLAAGVAVARRRWATFGGGALTIYYALVVVALMNGRIVVAHPREFGVYSGTAEQLAIAAATLVVYATHAPIREATARRLVDVAQRAFGLCAVLFGGAHFVYLSLTAPLVPGWLPPSQTFWACATGVAQIAAGLALVIGVKARLAALLLAAMYGVFAVLVHAPMFVGDPANRTVWNENALNFALIGVAWVIADARRAITSSGCRSLRDARRTGAAARRRRFSPAP